MINMLRRMVANETAQDLAEYGIALAVIGTAAGLVALAVHIDINALWTRAQTVIHSAV